MSLLIIILLFVVPANVQQSVRAEKQNVIFTSVSVDPDVVPNKQFKVSATVRNSDSDSRQIQVTIKVPDDISVSGSVIKDLGSFHSDREDTATWTLIAGRSGSFPIILTAYSTDSDSGDSENVQFAFDISVGSKGLAITQMDIPGNIGPNDEFPVVVKLKNTGTSNITNTISQLSVPAGLQVLDSTSQNIASITPGQEVILTWNLRAVSSGSYTIIFSYSSSDAGTNSLTGSVNVGTNAVAELKPSKILLGVQSSESYPLRPGDNGVPMKIVLTNTGTVDLHNITATLQLKDPFSWNYLENGKVVEKNVQSYSIASIKVAELAEASYFVSLARTAVPGLYIEQLLVSFNDGNKMVEKTYDLPFQISSDVILSISANQVNVEPGKVTPVVFNITNNGQEAVHSLAISTVNLDSAFSSVDSPVWIGDLGSGETKTVTMSIFTAPQTVTVSPLELGLDFQAGGRTFQQTQEVAVNIVGQSDFALRTVKVTPAISYPGDVGDRIDLELTNAGYAVTEDVSAILALPDGLSPSWGDSNSVYIGKMLPDQTSVASFYVNIDSSTPTGSYPLNLVVKHAKGESQVNVNFIVAAKAKFDLVNIIDSALYPGATNAPVKAVIKNTGSANAQAITTTFLGGNVLPGVRSNTVTAVGNVESVGDTIPGQSFTTTFIVNVDPTSRAGDQSSTVQIDWTQEGNTFSQTLVVPVHIAEGPAYLIYYLGVPWTYVIIVGLLVAGLISFATLRRRKISLVEPSLGELSAPALSNELKESVDRNPRGASDSKKKRGWVGVLGLDDT
jgi:hypothetical protein